MTQERLVIPIDVDLTPMRTKLAGLDTSISKLNQISLAPLKSQFAGLQKLASESLQVKVPRLEPMSLSVSADTELATQQLSSLKSPLVAPLSIDSKALKVELPKLKPVEFAITTDTTAIDAAYLSKSKLAQPVEIQIDTSGVDLGGIVTDVTADLGAITKATLHTQAAFDQMSSGNVVGSLDETKSAFGTVSSAATTMQFKANAATKTLTAMSVVLSPIKLLGNQFGLVAGSTSLAADTAAHFSAGLGVMSGLAAHAAIGLALILAPLRGLVIVPKLVAGAFGLMFAAIIAPFRVVFAVVTLAAKGVWALAQPFIALASIVFRTKILFASFKLQIALLAKFLSFLPPKMRVVVGGLVLLGMSGRAGALAMKTVAFAIRPLTMGLQALKVVLGTITFQFKTVIRNLAKLTVSFGFAAAALTRLTFRTSIAGLKGLGKASASVTRKIGGGLVGAFSSAIKWGSGLLAIGAGWGIKLAADAEQAQIAFKIMLKSGDAARAVLGKLEQFAASTPFQLSSLRDGAKQLLNAQVPATNLTNRLRMLGDIAAGTGKPIIDFVRIFAKVKSVGKVSLETLNQLAERGVPIYDALQKQLGKSRTEMLKMIGKGKVGFAQLDGALKSVSVGAGVFAGGMAAQSQSVTGLFSTLKDNVGFAMRSLGTEIMEAFNFKGLMARGITMFQSLKAGIASARPAFTALATVVKAAFAAVWEVVTVTFNAITSALGITGGNWMESFVTWAAVASFAFKNWPTLAELAFTKVALFLVRLGSDFHHTFAVALPTVANWFWTRLTDYAKNAGDFVGTVFANMVFNIRNVMKSVWAYLKSGGTRELKLAWSPLTEGFKSEFSKLPNIPKQVIGPLERALAADSKRLGSALSSGLATEIGKNLKMLDKFKLEQAQIKGPSLADIETPEPINVETANTEKSERKSTLVESLDRGSMEALKAIYEGQRQDQTAQKQLTVQKQIKNGILKLVAKPVPEFDIAGAVT